MTAFSFVHAADLHLDAAIGGLGQGLFSPGPAEERQNAALLRAVHNATFAALDRLAAFCIQKNADFLLLAGDVYNSAQSSLRARLHLRDVFSRLKNHGVGVFLAHGNHDPLKGEGGVIPWPDNVTVFGPAPGAFPALRRGGGEAVALVRGVSHKGPKEGRNLAAELAAYNSPLAGQGLFDIGLLHCAVTALAGSHALYAPCTLEDLRRADLGYWALGHVHAPRVLDRQGAVLDAAAQKTDRGFESPLAAYPGSLQGLHVNEAGPHGCLWGRVGENGLLRLDFVPLAPLRWENLNLEPGQETKDIPELERRILRLLEELAPAGGGRAHEKADSGTANRGTASGDADQNAAEDARKEADGDNAALETEQVFARLGLTGRSPLYRALRQPGALEDLREHLNAELADSGLQLRDLANATRPLLDLEALAERRDLAGESLRVAEALLHSPQALAEAAAPVLAPLFAKPRLRRALLGPGATAGEDAAPQDEELAALASEAALLCLELLDPGDGEDEDNGRMTKGGG